MPARQPKKVGTAKTSSILKMAAGLPGKTNLELL